MRFALEWGDGGISKPLRVDPAKRSMGGSRWLDCRGKDGETTRRPHRGSLRPPRFPTVHATDSRNRRSLGLALTAVGGSRPYKTGTIGYSTKCVFMGFCELRVDGVLWKFAARFNTKFTRNSPFE